MRGYRRRGCLPFLLQVLILLLLFSFGFWIADRNLAPTVLAIGELEARSVANEAINRAIQEKVASGIKYQDVISFQKDNQGRIALLQANTQEINRVAAEATLAIQQEFRKLTGRRFSVPLGRAFGSQVLANYGPRIPLTLVPVGAVLVTVRQEFQDAGINQTRHVISLHAEAQIRVVIPLLTREITVGVETPISEAVIVGPVPDVLWGRDRWGPNNTGRSE